MARGDQLGRQWKIIQRLIAARAGVAVPALAEALDCHRRTVYRDLEALQTAGFPLYTERADGQTRWRMLESGRRPVPVPLGLAELLALHLGRDMLQSALRGTHFDAALDAFFQKIRSLLPPEYLRHLDRLEGSLQVGPRPGKNYGGLDHVIEQVRDAVMERRYVEMAYHTLSRGAETERRVAPYNLYFFDGAFYLIGHCQLRGSVRVFALDRIRRMRVTGERFDPPADFDIGDYMQSSFGIFHGEPVRVRVRFSPRAAAHVRERRWHQTQTLTESADGSVVFEAEVAGTDEIRFWILRWGADARVLEPASLREQIRSEARAMLAGYETPEPAVAPATPDEENR